MRWAVATVLLARSAAADPAVDYQRAKLHALTAHNLAHGGHCDEALALRPRIEALDAEVARAAYAEDPLLVACMKGPGVAPPSLTPISLPAPPPAPPLRCTPGPFVDVMFGGTGDGLFHRVSAGYALRTCDHALALGVNAHAAAAVQDSGTDGAGFNVEPSLRSSEVTRLGLYLSYDWDNNGRRLYGAEARLHVADVFFVEAGVVHLTPETYAVKNSETLAVFGFGAEGKPGLYLGGAELVLAGIALAIVAGAGGISGGD